MRSFLPSVALVTAAFLLGCQDSGPVGPDTEIGGPNFEHQKKNPKPHGDDEDGPNKGNSGGGTRKKYKATGLLGPLLPLASVPADPPQLRAWQDRLETAGEVRWTQDAGLSDPVRGSVQYDRAFGWYTHWLRGGDDKWRDRAVDWALAYRADEAPDYKPPAHNYSMYGVALHYLLTGDIESKTAVLSAAVAYRNTWGPRLGNKAGSGDPWMNGRIQSKTLLGAIQSHLVDPAAGWDAIATGYITPILNTQDASGAFFFDESCGGQQSFMIGMLHQALIAYHTLISPDSRIPDAILNSLTWTWDTQWVEAASAFQYYSVDVCDGGSGRLTPAVDLNAYFPLPFYWLYAQTGNTVYRDRGDAILASTMDNAWWGDPNPGMGAKQYNQQIMTVGAALYWREQ